MCVCAAVTLPGDWLFMDQLPKQIQGGPKKNKGAVTYTQHCAHTHTYTHTHTHTLPSISLLWPGSA